MRVTKPIQRNDSVGIGDLRSITHERASEEFMQKFGRELGMLTQSVPSFCSVLAILSLLLPQIVAAAADPFSGLRGQFSVNARGAAIYSLPLEIPSGVGGLTPSLSLTYNSQSKDGIAGVGWNLSGIPAITICQPTVAQDGNGATVSVLRTRPGQIQFCLGGERLIPIAGLVGADGTEYRTERDQFLRITSVGTDPYGIYGGVAPMSFVVQARNGQTMEFGTDDNDHARRKWSLKRVTDPNNNYYTISYLAATDNPYAEIPYSDGVQYPERIDYSGNSATGAPKRLIIFRYGVKSDALALKYDGGFPIRDDKYLYNINIVVGTDSVSQYYLNYSDGNYGDGDAPMHLHTIQRCLYSTCLPPLTLGWMQDGTSPGIFQSPYIGSAFPGNRNDYLHFFVDVAGTGKKWWIQISTGADEVWIGSAKDDGTFSSDRWQRLATPMGRAGDFDYRFADVNGDGKADWIRIEKATGNASIALGKGDGTFDFWTSTISSMGSSATYQHEFGDINGDGRADWYRITRTTGDVSIAQAAPDGKIGSLVFAGNVRLTYLPAEYRVQDVTADGLADVIAIGRGASTLATLAVGDGTGKLAQLSPGWGIGDVAATQLLIDDLNGDGIPDVAGALEYTDGRNPSLKITFGKGDGRSDGRTYTARPFGVGAAGDQYFSGDFNGDGKSVLVNVSPLPTGGAIAIPVARYTPIEVTSGNSIFLPGLTLFAYYAADLNGDGKDDVVQVDHATGAAKIGLGIGRNNERVVSFTNGLEPATVLSYRDLADASIYTPENDGSGPIIDQRARMLPAAIAKKEGLQSRFYVVSSVATPTGNTSTMTTTYRYGGLKLDRDRRVLLGFHWIEALQVETGRLTHSEFQQIWPYSGSLMMSVTKASTGQTIGQLVNSSGCMDFVSTSGCVPAIGRRYFPYISQSISSSWELNGSALPSIITATQYDSYGNATKVTTNSSDGFTKTIETIYSNDTSKWWLGRPTRTTVTDSTQ